MLLQPGREFYTYLPLATRRAVEDEGGRSRNAHCGCLHWEGSRALPSGIASRILHTSHRHSWAGRAAFQGNLSLFFLGGYEGPFLSMTSAERACLTPVVL